VSGKEVVLSGARTGREPRQYRENPGAATCAKGGQTPSGAPDRSTPKPIAPATIEAAKIAIFAA